MLTALLLFIACSLSVGMTPWPKPYRTLALVNLAVICLISLLFSLLLLDNAWGWFAIGPTLRSSANIPVFGTIFMLSAEISDFLAFYSQHFFPRLPLNQGVCLLLLLIYSIWRTSLLTLLTWNQELAPYPWQRIASLIPGLLGFLLPPFAPVLTHAVVWTGLWLLWLERDSLYANPRLPSQL